jgi:hypothetical protein
METLIFDKEQLPFKHVYKERSSTGQEGFKPNQPRSHSPGGHPGLLAISLSVEKDLPQSRDLLGERYRSAPELLSD